MKHAKAVLCLSLLLAGCGRRDAKLHQLVTGTWTNEGSFTTTLAADGSFVSRWKSGDVYQGTWIVRDGALVTTLTNCMVQNTTNYLPAGTLDHFSILQADGRNLVFNDHGHTVSLKRSM